MPARGLQDEEGQQPPVLNDLEVTEITRVKLGAIGTATKVLADARTELTKASFALPANAQNITAKVQALANAEQALASSRADAYANLLKTYKDASPEKKRAVTNALSGTGGGGRGGN